MRAILQLFVVAMTCLLGFDAFAGSHFESQKYGVSGTLPTRWEVSYQGTQGDGSFQVMTKDSQSATTVVAVATSPQGTFTDVTDWIERHEVPDLFSWYAERLGYTVVRSAAVETITLGSGQIAKVSRRVLQINGNTRNVAFIYGTSGKSWFYVFLGNEGQQADLSDDIKRVAASIMAN